MRKVCAIISAAAMLAVAGSAQANLLVYEGFAGYGGVGSDIAGQAGSTAIGFGEAAWSGSGGGGLGNKNLDADTLTYTDANGSALVVSAGSARSNGTWNRLHRGLGAGNDNLFASKPGGGSVWVSYLFRPNGAPDGGPNQVRFYGAGGWDSNDKVSFDVVSESPAFRHQVQSFVWAVSGTRGGGALFRANQPVTSEANLIVAQYILDDSDVAGNQSAVYMWINPLIGGLDPDTMAASSSLTGLGGMGGINRLSIAADANGDFQVNWDEIRVGTSFSSVTPVIPEPASIAVLGAVAAMALRRRA
jgi:hypothetical protein